MRFRPLLLALLLGLGPPAGAEAPEPAPLAPAVEVRHLPVPEDPRLRLVAAAGPAEEIAKDLVRSVAADWRRIEAILGRSDPRPLEIRIAYGRESFDALQPPDVRAPGWAAGVAFSRLGLVVVDAQASGRAGSVRTVLLHEFAHIALGRLTEGRIPRWFNEGFALQVAGEWSRTRSGVVARAVMARALIPLSDLDEDWPHSLTDVDLAYAQSASMVGHLLSVENGDALRRLVAKLHEGIPFATALHEAYGKPLVVLETEWKRSLTHRYGWLAVLMDSELLWAGAALLLVLGAWRRKWKRRKRLEEMEAEEALEDPRFEEPPGPPWERMGPTVWSGAPASAEEEVDAGPEGEEDDPFSSPPPRNRLLH